MKKKKKLMIEGGRAFRLKKKLSSIEESSDGETCLFPNLLVMNKAHSDRPEQTKKRMVKLNWLIRNIPRGGPRAKEILKPRKK